MQPLQIYMARFMSILVLLVVFSVAVIALFRSSALSQD